MPNITLSATLLENPDSSKIFQVNELKVIGRFNPKSRQAGIGRQPRHELVSSQPTQHSPNLDEAYPRGRRY